MSEEKELPKTAWKAGQTGNPKGRPKGTSRPISRLRSTLNKLKELEPDAVDIIARAIEGDGTLDKSQLDTAKWVIQNINTLTRGAIAEESYKLDVKDRQEEEKANGTTGVRPKPRLSLKIIDED